MSTRNTPQSAILLLGPTGSGKTPLGDMLAARGLNGVHCAHFDFGEHLRRIAAGTWIPQSLSPEDARVVTRSIQERTLLTDKQFHIAEAILRAFISEHALSADDAMLVLNGMPRHTDQAIRVDTLTHVKLVIELQCTPDVVFERIHRNTGGDRTDRNDDALDGVRHKLEIYQTQTLPLIAHYRALNTPVLPIVVHADSVAEDMLTEIEKQRENNT